MDAQEDRVEEIADEIMAYLRDNEKYFTPRQLILSHSVKNLLVQLLELVEEGKLTKAKKKLFRTEAKLFSLYKEKLRK